MARSKSYGQMQRHSDFEKSTAELIGSAPLRIDHFGVGKVIGNLRVELKQVI